MSGIQAMMFNSASGPTLTFNGSYQSNTSATSVSTSFSIGAANSTRVVIIAFGAGKDSGGFASNPYSSVTIGGVSATLAVYSNVNTATAAVIYYASVPTGTSATVSFSIAAACHPILVDCWSATDLSSSTPSATNGTGGTATSQSVSLTIPSSGFAIGCVGSASNSPTLSSWTNMTAQTAYSQSNGAIWTASYNISGAATRTANFTSSIGADLVVAAWS